jgi:hypothetical protein
MKIFTRLFVLVVGLFVYQAALAQDKDKNIEYVRAYNQSKFEQLETLLPTPNTYRTASGAPGHQYWQQRADYVMNVELDEDNRRMKGSETITYYNNSPDELKYIWVQLDQNLFRKDSDTYASETGKINEQTSFRALQFMMTTATFEGGYTLSNIRDAKTGQPLRFTVNKTMMRIDLPQPIKPSTQFSFSLDWSFNIVDHTKLSSRGGYEFFPADGNCTFSMAQFFPRMAVYSDNQGWQHKQFLGRGEFTLPFGDYKVNITVPADHVVGATGELLNPNEVLTATQRERLAKARTSNKPVVIVTEDEAKQAEKSKATGKKTWKFAAANVRDFAWASSRKFIWDGMNAPVAGKNILAMSLYPKEGNPLWGQYSTEAVAHTLKTYSKFTIDYPYPVCYSVHSWIGGGMEYPMLSFNGGRPEADGTYSQRTKYGMISVIIHEVGHNFFPMIVNSDERQWTWMDEGLNSFVQMLTEMEWERNYPGTRGTAAAIVPYMKSELRAQVPIMSNSENILQFGPNAYSKPATGLNILRETIMGRELFDYAFKEYSRRWAFKHPTPADFFRTMEDASAVDLDWFWRGWFYTTDRCDISLADVTMFRVDTQNPEVEKPKLRAERAAQYEDISAQRNKTDLKTVRLEENPDLKDFYNRYDPLAVAQWDVANFQKYIAGLDSTERKMLNAASGMYFYQMDFKNVGGLVMPIILEVTYTDDSKEVIRIPAEVWRLNDREISKVFMLKKELKSVILDPFQETPDTDLENNYFPPRMVPTRFQLFKQRQGGQPNPMQLEKQFQQPPKQGGSN